MNATKPRAGAATPQATNATAASFDRGPLAFDALALERSLRHVHGASLDDVIAPRPFPSAEAPFRLERGPSPVRRHEDPWTVALAELDPKGLLPPGVLGADVPLAEELAVAAALDGGSIAHAHARRWVARIMGLTNRGISVHPAHIIVAHLGLAWAAHLDGEHGESARAACVARFTAALPSGAGGLGTAAFVRAAKLFAMGGGGLDAADLLHLGP